MNTRPLLFIFLGAAAVSSALLGCGDDETTSSTVSSSSSSVSSSVSTGSTGGGGSGGASSSSSAGGSGGGTGGSGGGTGGTGGGSSAQVVHPFDPMMGELPEGLAMINTKAYVGLAALSKVVTVDVPSGTTADFATGPDLGGGANGYLLGLAFDAGGQNLYAGVASFNANVVAGIYSVGINGGAMTQFATDPAMSFVNGLALTPSGDLLATDSAAGTIFQVTIVAQTGVTSTWLTDPLLAGAKDNCPNAASPFDIGANGIVVTADAAYVANTNLATIVKIPIDALGNPGVAAVFAGPDCDKLGGADGLAMDTDGSLLVAVNSGNAIARVSADGKTITTIAQGAPLDAPASDAITTVNGKKTLVITNAAFFSNPMMPSLSTMPLP